MTPELKITTCRTCPFAHRNPVKIFEVPLKYTCMAASATLADVSEMVHQGGRPEWCPLRGKKIAIQG